MPDTVEQRHREDSPYEALGDLGHGLQLGDPEEAHEEATGNELPGSKEPRQREDVEGLLIDDVKDHVEGIP